MLIRILIILGAVILLGVGGCVGTSHYGGAYYHSDGYDPWYYGRYPYAGYFPTYSYPDYFFYPRHRHYPYVIDKRPYYRHDHHVIIDNKAHSRHGHPIVKDNGRSDRNFYNRDIRRDDDRGKGRFDRQLTREDRRQKSHEGNRFEPWREGRPDRNKAFSRPQRGLKCSGTRC